MIHILIPTYLQRGYGPQYLDRLLASIAAQKNSDYHVWISDNDDTGAIKKVVDKHSFPKLTYAYNPVCGASENINNVIRMAGYTDSNARMKLMCMDDLLLSPMVLYHFEVALEIQGWAISDSVVINSRDAERKQVKAVFDPKIFHRNTVGMPSCIAWRYHDSLSFDLGLKTFCDTDFYHQLYQLYGQPYHIQKPLIGQRYHPHSQSRNQPATHEKDAAILKQRYG